MGGKEEVTRSSWRGAGEENGEEVGRWGRDGEEMGSRWGRNGKEWGGDGEEMAWRS